MNISKWISRGAILGTTILMACHSEPMFDDLGPLPILADAELVPHTSGRLQLKAQQKGTLGQLFSLDAEGQADYVHPVELDTAGLLPASFRVNAHPHFVYIQGKDTQMVAQRRLPLDGSYNFRDMGGIKTIDGYTVKFNKLFRSGSLADLSEDDKALLNTINFSTFFDFRRHEEIEAEPDPWEEMGVNYLHVPIGDTSLSRDKLIELIQQDTFQPEQVLIKGNRDFPKITQPQFTQYFETLLKPDSYPMLYHCTAGKDRTGLASVLVLSAIGVDRETVVQDYLLSNHHILPFAEEQLQKAAMIFGDNAHKLGPLMEVRAEYIQQALNVIDNEFGGMDNYLETALGVGPTEREQLKGLLLDGYTPVQDSVMISLDQ
ncbi:tyrosine-protein phosphatase [Pontibacter sp. G13]|uniref:tyrosine-protein phosphatase n=1 Tax=Pontibacter sp. G13 TaxID=3074898 RepID=UPI00288BBD53|nr:tyrosine-protein phosphatase [Pontibacter sp. G13]WNJ18462.1 tyrosine-protein phosphatase [Pontibacter sp. G13]